MNEEETAYKQKPSGEMDMEPEDEEDIIGFDDDEPVRDKAGDELEELEMGSVHALTIRDDVDYEDNKQKATYTYAAGYGPDDDLNNDGFIDPIESQIKVNAIKEEIADRVDNKIKEDYLKRFRAEVDFHHKVAYRFEKAYRLGKKMTNKKKQMNMEIIEIISEHSDYIEQDPMALFYCLYFCIYYKNPDLVEFLRTLISKMNVKNKPDKIDEILNYIDVNGIDVLRT